MARDRPESTPQRRHDRGSHRSPQVRGQYPLAPRHLHPAGEEVFVLEGRARFEETWYETGFYLYSPPDSADDVFTDTGAILFVSLPKPHVDLE